MSHIAYDVTVKFPLGELERLQAIKTTSGFLFPQGVKLSEVWLTLTPEVVTLHYLYWGQKPNGIVHRRRTADRRYLEDSDWLWTLFPAPLYPDATVVLRGLEALWAK